MAEDQFKFDSEYNFSKVFLRDATLAFANELNNELTYTNVFESSTKDVSIPFFYSYMGEERYLLDLFVDDIPGDRPEGNYDPIPRAVITLDKFQILTSEIKNPNVYVQTWDQIDGELKRTVSKWRPLPIKLAYSIEIKVASEIDTWKIWEAIWSLYQQSNYNKFYFHYNGFKIDCYMNFPDSQNYEQQRQISGITGQIDKSVKFNSEMTCVYPVKPQKGPIITLNKRVKYKGNIWTLGKKNSERNFIGIQEKNNKNPKNEF